jgi:hypothetical protein
MLSEAKSLWMLWKRLVLWSEVWHDVTSWGLAFKITFCRNMLCPSRCLPEGRHSRFLKYFGACLPNFMARLLAHQMLASVKVPPWSSNSFYNASNHMRRIMGGGMWLHSVTRIWCSEAHLFTCLLEYNNRQVGLLLT